MLEKGIDSLPESKVYRLRSNVKNYFKFESKMMSKPNRSKELDL